ncbi:MAG: iron-containing redox enzyme family protein [Pseudorhodoferax sp.]
MHSTHPSTLAEPASARLPTGTPRQAYPCSDDRYPASIGHAMAPARASSYRAVYEELVNPATERLAAQRRSLALLRDALDAVASRPDDLPASPEGLFDWMTASAKKATDAYRDYLAQRRAGAPRRFFSNRTHALYFLQAVAPTKLVDGSWLFGCMRHARDPRMAGLAQTYLEELGNGDAGKNHVLLYRELLRAHGLNEGTQLGDEHFEQGAIQLALGHATEQMLPEVIGFNLGYEQLPLHLLVTAYELDELGLDPYYFTLHVTVDNADSGHARKAIDAVALNAARFADARRYWERVRQGYRLNDLGLGTGGVIAGFDLDAEVLRIFMAKSAAGAGAHSDYCRIEGRTVNAWLGEPARVGEFLQALVRKGWIVPGADPEQSRFWRLLVGERAEMFGVFSDYELQALFDWIRGPAAADGRRYDAPAAGPSFRAAQRLRARAGADRPPARDAGQPLLAPGAHWTSQGLEATRALVASLRG